MASTSKEKQAAKRPRKVKPEISTPEQPKDDGSYISVKPPSSKNPIKEIFIEINYTPNPDDYPFSFKIGARQELESSNDFDEESSRLWARLIAKIDEIRPDR